MRTNLKSNLKIGRMMSNLPINDRIGVFGMAVVSGVLSKFAEWKGLRTLCSSRMLR